MTGIKEELRERLVELKSANKLVEEQRLQQRTLYDLEMLEQMGRCKGIENYSRHLSGRAPGEPPPTLLDYFPKDYLLFVDESHQTIPQVVGDVQRRPLAQGDAGRLRLPAAVGDGQPAAALRRVGGARSSKRSTCRRRRPSTSSAQAQGVVVEQIIRPTGLLDPEIEVRPVASQVDDLLGEIRERVKAGERVLCTTLTKRMAEDLTEYYAELGVRVRYLHSDIDTLERIEILRDLRLGEYDVLVGINLLREGLDLPEVSLVGILDADKEGFLRAERSLIQTIGRAARNVRGKVLMYADRETDSMRKAISVTRARRATQEAYNKQHGITPKTIQKAIADLAGTAQDDFVDLSRPDEEEGVRHPARGAASDPVGHAQGDARSLRGAGVREGRRRARQDQGAGRAAAGRRRVALTVRPCGRAVARSSRLRRRTAARAASAPRRDSSAQEAPGRGAVHEPARVLGLQHGHRLERDVEDVGLDEELAAERERGVDVAHQLRADHAPLLLARLPPRVGEVEVEAVDALRREQARQVDRHVGEDAVHVVETGGAAGAVGAVDNLAADLDAQVHALGIGARQIDQEVRLRRAELDLEPAPRRDMDRRDVDLQEIRLQRVDVLADPAHAR